ncbi:MAG: 2-oxoacid:acceptor oxidoreductase subunit alpha [Nitrososphaerota archaeon]|nr:2-oxoacid:acceptor oxidoreductase subunit alpha [Nitrososphaerota archaeon]
MSPDSSDGRDEFTVRLAAAAGDGVQSAGEMMVKVLSRAGQYISTYNGNQSLIRGGEVWFHIHSASEKVYSLGYGVDYLVPLSQSAYEQQHDLLNNEGTMIFDSSTVRTHDLAEGVRELDVPLTKIALKYDKRPIMKNTVALGALTSVVGIKFDLLAQVITEQFRKKDASVVENNVNAAREGYEQVAVRDRRRREFDYGKPKSAMTANYALALGAVNAGCRFYAAYPMSPASSIVHWMASHAKELGVTVFLGEDEISVINATIGASYAGARAMCATSGGGFALMQEAIGEAAMTETPVVVVDVMRAGPSTGLPTKTSQGDLNMMLGISQDDFPRILIAPRTASESFQTAERAFNLAERYQVPAIILLDFAIGDGGYATMEGVDPAFTIDRGKVTASAPSQDYLNGTWFKRYALTPDGISYRSFPGAAGLMHVDKTDEHDEWGHDISDVRSGLKEFLPMRVKMQEKRMKKLDSIKKESKLPELFGPSSADITLVSWGSSANAAREAIQRLRRGGASVNGLEFTDLYPLDEAKVKQILGSSGKKVAVEANYSGQFEMLLRRETGVQMDAHIRKYDGEPFYPLDIEKGVLGLRKEVRALA